MSVEFGAGYGNILHRGRQDKEFADHPPIMRLFYNYKYDMPTMAMAYMHKYTWEPKWSLSTICSIEHSDDDKLVYIRRHDTIVLPEPTFERVTIDRKTKSMTAQTLGKNTDGTETTIQMHEFQENNGSTHNTFHIFQGADKSLKVESFKIGIANTIRAIKFAQFDKEK